MNELITIEDVQKMAIATVKSGLFGLPTAEAALSLMLLCQSEGIHPIQAVKRYHIIKGRPAMRSDAMLAEFQRQGGKVEWLERTDKAVRAKFSHESSGSCEFCWSIDQAKQAGLIGNPTWQKFPRQMLTARVISEAVRTMLPGVVCGVYTPEEIQDFDEQPKAKKTGQGEAKNMSKVVEPTEDIKNVTAPTEIEAKPLSEKIKEAEPEMLPEDAEIVYPAADVKPAERPSTSAKQMAEQFKQVRALAQKWGCKNAEQFTELMQLIIGKDYTSASQLTDDSERLNVVEWLEDAIRERENG